MLKIKVEVPDDLNPQETSEWVEALDEIAGRRHDDSVGTAEHLAHERPVAVSVTAKALAEALRFRFRWWQSLDGQLVVFVST